MTTRFLGTLAGLLFIYVPLCSASDSNQSLTVEEPPLPTAVPPQPNLSQELLIAFFENWTQTHSDDPKGWYGLGLAYLKAERLDDARNALGKAFDLDLKERTAKGEDTAQTAIYARRCQNLIGLLEFKRGDLTQAADAFNKAIQLDPTYGAAWSNLGLIQERQQNNDEALVSIKKALTFERKLPAIWTNLAQACVNKKMWQDAHDAAKQATTLDPQFLNALLLLGESSFQLKQWEEVVESDHEALDVLDARHHSILTGDRDYALALREYGSACVSIHHYDDADKILTQARTIAPNDPDILAATGLLYILQGRWNEVVDPLQKAVALNPNLYGAWYGLGATYLERLHQPAQAAKAYGETVKLKPDFAGAWRGLGMANRVLKNNADAAVAFRKATELDPTNVDAWRELALVTSDPAESEKALAQAISLNPKDAVTFGVQAEIAIHKNDWPAAEKALRVAMTLKPDNPAYWSLLASSLYMQKKFAEAATVNETSIQNGANLPPARVAIFWGSLAECHMAQGPTLGPAEWQTAVDALNHAIALVPNSSNFWFDLYTCDTILKRKDEAAAAQAKWKQLGGVLPHLMSTGNAPAGGAAPAPVKLPASYVEVNAIKGLIQNKQFDEALKKAQDDTVNHPDVALSWYSLGDVLVMEKRYGAT